MKNENPEIDTADKHTESSAKLASEIISGQYGIGYLTRNAYSLVEYENIVI